MKNILETLWYESGMFDFCGRDEDMDKLASLIDGHERKLRGMLDDVQIEVFDKYCGCVEEFGSLECFRAFAVGVRFAVRLMAEVMYTE